jgi:hypothetical protein
MSFIISDNLVGTIVRVLSRHDQTERARGVVRAVAMEHGSFVILLQSTETRDGDSYYQLVKGEFLQVSTFDETVHVVADAS